jgi:hypothetical protein
LHSPVSSALSDDDEKQARDLPVVVLDDSTKICNTDALVVLLDQLPFLSQLVQQRACQDLFVLLKYEPANRRIVLGAVAHWQALFAAFVSGLDRLSGKYSFYNKQYVW